MSPHFVHKQLAGVCTEYDVLLLDDGSKSIIDLVHGRAGQPDAMLARGGNHDVLAGARRLVAEDLLQQDRALLAQGKQRTLSHDDDVHAAWSQRAAEFCDENI